MPPAPIAFEIIPGSKPFGQDRFLVRDHRPGQGMQGGLDGLVGERNVALRRTGLYDRFQDRWMASRAWVGPRPGVQRPLCSSAGFLEALAEVRSATASRRATRFGPRATPHSECTRRGRTRSRFDNSTMLCLTQNHANRASRTSTNRFDTPASFLD